MGRLPAVLSGGAAGGVPICARPGALAGSALAGCRTRGAAAGERLFPARGSGGGVETVGRGGPGREDPLAAGCHHRAALRSALGHRTLAAGLVRPPLSVELAVPTVRPVQRGLAAGAAELPGV